MNIRFGVLALVLVGFTLAQSAGYKLVVNGQTSNEKVIVVNSTAVCISVDAILALTSMQTAS